MFLSPPAADGLRPGQVSSYPLPDAHYQKIRRSKSEDPQDSHPPGTNLYSCDTERHGREISRPRWRLAYGVQSRCVRVPAALCCGLLQKYSDFSIGKSDRRVALELFTHRPDRAECSKQQSLNRESVPDAQGLLPSCPSRSGSTLQHWQGRSSRQCGQSIFRRWLLHRSCSTLWRLRCLRCHRHRRHQLVRGR